MAMRASPHLEFAVIETAELGKHCLKPGQFLVRWEDPSVVLGLLRMLSSFVFLAACVLLFSSLLWSETRCLLGLLCWMDFALFSFVFLMNLLTGV